MLSSSDHFTVLGASGFIGSRLVSSLRAGGYPVYAPARGDMTLFRRKLGHVIYCIGMTADFRTRPFDTIHAHVSVLADILARADFASLLYLSSTRLYANTADSRETVPIQVDSSNPSDLYNISKLAGESLCRSCGRDGVKVARLSNVVGFDHDSENFLFALIREALSGRIELQSDPGCSKDYILLEDVVSLLPRICTEGREWLYNLASGLNLRHQDIVARLVDLTGCEIVVRPSAPLFNFSPIDTARIRSEFSFLATPVLDALPDLVNVFRERKNRPTSSGYL